MDIEIQVLKFIEDFALVEAVVTVDSTVVARGRLGFARKSLQPLARHDHSFIAQTTDKIEE